MSNLLKSKFLMGVMIVAILFVGVFALTTVTKADDACTITMTLKSGVVSDQVECLQAKLGMTARSTHFGPLTLAAVKAYQTSHSIPATGTVGPLTRAALNGSPVVSTGTCPAGYTAVTPVAPNFAACVVSTPAQGNCPAGYVAVTPVAPTFAACVVGGTVVPGQTDGSITASTSSYVSSGISVKKGETKDVAAVRLQAVVGPVKVTRVDVQFNVRPWLFFSTVTLHDNAGKVLATKTLSSIADTTEITVGSLYQVRFDNVDYTVTPGTNPDLAVGVTVLAATDKIPTLGQSVTTGVTALRTLSEIGYNDTVTYNGTNTVTLTSTGSVADIYSRISPTSPLAGQQVVNATVGNTTADVVLGAFSLKSANNASTLNTLAVSVLGTATASTDFSNFRLYVGGNSVAGGTLSGTTITFSNMTVPLAVDTWTDLTIKADVAGASSGTVYLVFTPNVNTITVTDANYGTPTIEVGARTTNTLTLTSNSVTVSAMSATLGSAIINGNTTTAYNATYAYTLTNNSNNDLYVSTTPATFATGTTAGSTGTFTNTGLTNVTLVPSTNAGDTGTSYAIPAGSSRTFTFSAVLRGTATTIFKIISINYNDASALNGNAGSITTGLSSLSLTASF